MMKWFILALMVVMAGSIQAAENEDGKEKGKIPKTMDANNDGSVCMTEFLASTEKIAKKNEKEFDKEKYEKLFAKKDKNGDGKLTADEFVKKPKKTID